MLNLTAEVEAAFQQQMAEYDRQTAEGDLLHLLADLLKDRYSKKRNLSVLELGPKGTTIVARALEGSYAFYTGLDYSPSCCLKQAQNFLVDGLTNAGSLCGNTYRMPVSDCSQDLVIASCHDPCHSGSEEELTTSFGQVHRVLRPGGEFVLCPWQEACRFEVAGDCELILHKNGSRQRVRMEQGKSYSSAPDYVAEMPFRFFTLADSRSDGTENWCVPPGRILVLKKE